MAERNRPLSRRGFLLLGTGTIFVGGLAGAWRRWQNIGTLGHESGIPGEALVNKEVRKTLVAFLGSAFGVRLSSADEQDLDARLAYAAERDGAWTREYRWLANYSNRLAAEFGAASFYAAKPAMRETLVHAILQSDSDNRQQRIRAFFDLEGRKLLRMRKSTIPHLFRLYRMSGVPWRQRGYVSWPGIPDERLAYTRPLPARRC